MVLNVIDFNNNLQKSYRSRYCIYRNLELGHEIHIWNENSKLIKACRQTLNPNIKKAIDTLSFSYTYELYKLFLMLNVGGWFIESDHIVYSHDISPEKTMPTYNSINNCCNFAAFITWSPVFIKNDKATNFYLKKSLDTLKMDLENNIHTSLKELIYQLIYIEPLYEGQDHEFIIPSFCQKYDLAFEHYSANHLLTHYITTKEDIKNRDADFILHYFFVDRGIESGYDEFSFDNLLKFDTFKIMP